MVTFPENPYDGQTIVDETGTNGAIVWTWSAENNEWTCKEYGAQGELLIYTDQVLVRDNTEATDALATPDQLSTQKDVNYWQTEQDKQLAQLSSRVADAVDFSQNTVGKGYWTHKVPPEAELHPRPGEFWTNDNETDFGKIAEFKFNDTGLPGVTNPGSLQGTREGDYLLVQCNGTNNFGYYVITGYETENISDQIIRTFTVKPFREERFKGVTTEGVRHTVSTLRPVFTIVQDEQPVVSTRGVFWYRERDDHLLISNYADGFVGEGPQWTDLSAGGGGGDYLPLTGGTMKGDVSMGGHKITALDTPVQPGQAANRGYVDDNFLSLKGGTIDGQVILNEGPLMVNGPQVIELPEGGHLFSVLGSDNGQAIFVINGAGSGKYFGQQTVDENIATVGYVSNYLPRAGGVMDYNSVLASKDSNGVTKNLFTYKGSELEFRAEIMKFKELSKLKMGGTYNNAIIEEDEGFTDNSLVPTLGFVKSRINRGLEGVQNTRNIRPYKFVNDRAITSLREGEIAFFDNQGTTNVSKPEDCFIMAFHGVNKTGERSAPDGDAIDYESYLGGHVSILNGDLTKTYMRVHGYGGIPSFTQINYFKEQDVYTIGWPDNMASPKVSSFTQFSNGQTVNLRIPDLFL